jgi:hypothetical protein
MYRTRNLLKNFVPLFGLATYTTTGFNDKGQVIFEMNVDDDFSGLDVYPMENHIIKSIKEINKGGFDFVKNLPIKLLELKEEIKKKPSLIYDVYQFYINNKDLTDNDFNNFTELLSVNCKFKLNQYHVSDIFYRSKTDNIKEIIHKLILLYACSCNNPPNFKTITDGKPFYYYDFIEYMEITLEHYNFEMYQYLMDNIGGLINTNNLSRDVEEIKDSLTYRLINKLRCNENNELKVNLNQLVNITLDFMTRCGDFDFRFKTTVEYTISIYETVNFRIYVRDYLFGIICNDVNISQENIEKVINLFDEDQREIKRQERNSKIALIEK